MGYTQHTVDLMEEIIIKHRPSKVIDLGAQNNYAQPKLPAPYMSEWYAAKGIEYVAVDLCKENGSLPMDLKEPVEDGIIVWKHQQGHVTLLADVVTDIGTSEHVSGWNNDGQHDIRAYYNCWKRKHVMTKPGGIIFSENPKTGNWINHGCNYVDMRFYQILAQLQGYEILHLVENAAMGNTTDGWNITCILRKPDDRPFMPLEDFKKCDVKTS